MTALVAAGQRATSRVVIAGGWTGGHLFCALAIAEALRRQCPAAVLLLVGARGGIEADLIRAAGFSFETVWAEPLARGWTWDALARNLASSAKLAVGGVQAARVLRTFRPDVVVGVGAYVSVPVVAAAQAMRIPTLLHEANVQPGLANRMLAGHAKVICVGSVEAERAFPPAPGRRIVTTGNPVRAALTAAADLSPREARVRVGLDPFRQTVLIMGGSLGSARLNEWVLAHGRELVADGAQVLWQCGRAHFDVCRARLGNLENLRIVPFVDDMAAAYAAAHLVVAGAGASTVAELACRAKAAIFVPDPTVTEDHQAGNARALRVAGVAVCDAASLGANLVRQVRDLLADGDRRRALSASLARLGRPDAAAAVAAEALALGKS